jgi:predicted DNA-binding ribbon-helix-helix protein
MVGKRTEAGREILVERVQTGVRLEKRLLKVLKAMAEYHDMTLGDLIEGIVLHAFDGKPAFGEESLGRIAEFKRLYHLDLDASASHHLQEREGEAATKKSAGKGKAGRKKDR